MSEQETPLDEFKRGDKKVLSNEPQGVRLTLDESYPVEWGFAELDEVCEVDSGFTWNKDQESDSSVDGAIPVIKINNVQDGYLDLEDRLYLTDVSDEDLRKNKARKDWLLMIGSNGSGERVGHCGIIETEREFVYASFLYGLNADSKHLLPHFLFYSLNRPKVQQRLTSFTAGSTSLKNLNKSIIENLSIPTPPLDEQRKIASVLYTVDQAIHKTDDVVSRTRRLKKGTIQDLLTQGIGDNELQEGRVGSKLVEYPKHWEIKSLGEICDIKGGKRLPKGHDYADNKTDYPYLRVVDFEDGTINESDLRYLPQETYQEINKYTISSDDVYISIAGTLGLAGTVPDELDGANLTENAAQCCNLQGVGNEFLKLYLRSSLGQAEVHRWTVGTSQPKLAIYRLRKFEVLVPPVEEQKEITHIINVLNHHIRISSRVRDHLIHLKSGLMQELLSGEVRTHDKDIEVVDKILTHG